MFRRFSRFWLGWLLWLSASSLASSAPDKSQPVVTVFAAIYLTNALQDIGDAFTKASGLPVRFTFGANSMLARVIDAGVHDDVFVSADTGWMDYYLPPRHVYLNVRYWESDDAATSGCSWPGS